MQSTLQAELDALPAADLELLVQQLDLEIKQKTDVVEMRREILKFGRELSLTSCEELRTYASKVAKPLETKHAEMQFHTRSDVASMTWNWVVEDFEQSYNSWQTGIWNGLKSGDFMIRNTQWRALIFKGQGPGFLFVGVGIANRNAEEHVISLRVQPLTSGPALSPPVARPTFSIPNYKLPGKHGMGEKLLPERQLAAFLDASGTLRLSFELDVRFGARFEQHAGPPAVPPPVPRGTPGWLEALWADRSLFSDVKLHVDGTAFPAHRCVLAAASAYFRLLLTAPMRESRESDITLKPVNSHLDAASFTELLRFIYTGAVEPATLDARPDSLLALADQFEVPALKSACEAKLLEKATVGNCLDLLALADTFHAPHMADCLFDLVVKNFMDVITTPAYARLAQSHPALFARLNLAACEQRGARKRKEPTPA